MMLFKTQGIVFRFTKYGETSVIVSIFTDAFGLQSYMVNGARSKGAKGKMALYQPLTLLDMVVYHRENANIQRIREVKCLHPYHTLTQDVRKSTVAMFINELLNKAVKDQSHPADITRFITDALIMLDEGPALPHFHLLFMIRLSRYLGFGPQTPDEILEGWPATPAEREGLQQLFDTDFDKTLNLEVSLRRNLVDLLIRFYQQHIENFGQMHSLPVLKEVFA